MSSECNITTLSVPSTHGPASAADAEAFGHMAVLLVCGAALVGSFVLTPNDEGLSLLGIRWPFHCWLHDTFGIKCALCGMSRSFCALGHGDLTAAWGFHRLGPVVFALFCLQVPYRLYALARRPRSLPLWLRRGHVGLVAMVAIAVLVHWIAYLGGLLL